MIKVAWS